MSPTDPNPEHASPSDETLVPGKETGGTLDPEDSGYRSQTRPLPVRAESGADRPFHQPTFGMPEPPRREVSICCWVAGVSSLTSVVLAVMLWMKTSSAVPPAPAPAPSTAKTPAAAPPAGSPEALHAALKPYLEAAQAGDVNAMRMLGTMYYHGLDLPRNREEGLKWYRKAAASGSKVAEQELKQLE
jgi:hypothetical protein